jgi:hypothetical protein
MGADEERPDVSQLLPVDRFHAFLDLAPADAAILVAAEEEIDPALTDHWTDVCAAFHDTDAHDLYVRPDVVREALRERAHISLSSISSDQPVEFRAQAADVAARSLKDAEPELEKLVRSGYRTVVTWPRRGEGERAAYNLARVKARWIGEDGAGAPAPVEPELTFATAGLRDGFIAAGIRVAILPEHRLFRRRAPSGRPGAPRPSAGAARCARSPTCARGTSSSTRTTACALRRLRDQDRRRRHPRLPPARVRRHGQGLHAGRPAREDLALRRRGRRAPAAVQARRQELGDR